MTDRSFAATPWEVEAERRREVIEADAGAARSSRPATPRDVLAVARGRRLLQSLRREPFDDAPRQAGRLNQKRV
jgi:hypothetical protein